LKEKPAQHTRSKQGDDKESDKVFDRSHARSFFQRR
jgi:hypothetical protein